MPCSRAKQGGALLMRQIISRVVPQSVVPASEIVCESGFAGSTDLLANPPDKTGSEMFANFLEATGRTRTQSLRENI